MLYFKLPFSEFISSVKEKHQEIPISFVSFDKSKILNFKGNIENFSKAEFLKTADFSTVEISQLAGFKESSKADYLKKVESVISFVKEHALSKLVISRLKKIDIEDSEIDFAQTFLNLCDSYPNAFAYLFIKDKQCWMGAFSEVLGKFDKKTAEFETMSLAGTLPINEEWTVKEIQEQQPVTDFIRNILKNYSSEILQSKTYDHFSGNIKHLRTDFKTKMQPQEVQKVIADLHPTPAVCGIPKDFCLNAISQFEEHSRAFYAGYIKVETEETVQYFVNLRCAEIFQNAVVIYAGGGITPDSSPEKEWRETELKADAILKNISFIS